MDWKRLEEAFAATATRAIRKVLRQNRDQTFYALALHESYRELDGPIKLPWAAVNSVQRLTADGEDGPPYDYAPANWLWRDIDVASKELDRLYAALNEEANRGTQNQWRRTERRFLATMVRVVKRLYKTFKDDKQTTDDFIAYFDDEDDGEELLQKCVPKRLLRKHFGHFEEQQRAEQKLDKSPKQKRLARYLADLSAYEDKLVAMGESAVDGLLGKLKDDDGWMAAGALGRIGVADKRVIQALRKEVRKSSGAAMWSAFALGFLGDHDFLLKQADNDATRKCAVSGIVASLLSWANGCVTPIPLSYAPLERLLAKKCRKCSQLALRELEPGRGTIQIRPEDVDEAIRGLASPHLVIRQHAACVLGERSLGKAAGAKILPALVQAFEDRHANVRRLALVNISYWKAAAKPYLKDIRRMTRDDDPNVRAAARYVLEELK